MRTLIFLCLILLMAGGTLAQNELLGDHFDKARHTRLSDRGTPDGRQGGEAIADAFPIPSIPFQDTGNTSDNLDDYDVVCPYPESVAPDVVYAFPLLTEDIYVSVDMCGSGYDTKIYILDADEEVIACNDDAYFGNDPCGTYVSKIEMVCLPGGQPYFLIIDGYGTEAGDYILNIEEVDSPPTCILECNGGMEGEPPLHEEYVDLWNSGCNDETGLFPFQELGGVCGPIDITFCGVAGWLGNGSRDTDWFLATIGYNGIIDWFLDAEQETYGFLLGGDFYTCENITIEEQILAGPCQPAHMTIQGDYGDLVFLWVGSTDYYPPDGFTGNEYDYVMELDGILQHPGVTATESINLDMIKTLYR